MAKRMVCGLLVVALGAALGAMQAADPPAATTGAASQSAAKEDYRLVWSDEFNKDGPLNPDDWGYEQGFVRNNELQWYQPENAVCKDGFLVIDARKESKPNPRYVPPATAPATTTAAGDAAAGGGRGRGRGRGAGGGGGGWQNRPTIEITAASVNTRGKHAWLYGRFEIRAKIDTRLGSWPAFWSLGVQGPWPANGEIDIMEYYRGMVLANIAWAGGNARGGTGATWNTVRTWTNGLPADWFDKFHTWRMDWDEQSIKLFLDDVLVNSQDLSKTINAQAGAGAAAGGAGGGRGRGRGLPALANPFHGPAYILLNQAIGGDNGGDPSNTQFPILFLVDYVRVWQTPAQIEATAKAIAATQRAATSAPATAPGQ